MKAKRAVFFISDRTGITAEKLGNSLLTQFASIQFSKFTLPFIDSIEKAGLAAEKIRLAAVEYGTRPLVFSTVLDPATRDIIAACDAFFMDFFEELITPLELELDEKSSRIAGSSHGIRDELEYGRRIDAVNFALGHDDGIFCKGFEHADIILLGVSRCGKTPTCLYLALQYSIRAANYPLTGKDFDEMNLPPMLVPYRNKLYGLSITPERLQQIRQERLPGSEYAALSTCRYEVRQAEALFRAKNISFLDSTAMSIEEIASTILHQSHLAGR